MRTDRARGWRIRHRRRHDCWSAGCRSTGWPSGSGRRRSSPTTARMITERVAAVQRRAPGADVELGYAVKANPMPAVVQHLAGLVDRLDVASAGEMPVALDTGQAPAAVSFAGPGKTDAELRRAVAAGVTVEVESRERGCGASCGDRRGARAAPARRRTRQPADFAVKGSGMRMGGGPQQFGVDAEAVPALLGELSDARRRRRRASTSSPGRRTSAPRSSARPRSATVELVLELAEHVPGPCSTSTSAAASASPTSRRTSASTSPPSVGEPRASSSTDGSRRRCRDAPSSWSSAGTSWARRVST